VFCGRERLTAALAGMLAGTGTGIVMVTGASGAGKTSLLRAGLVPALARGVQVPGSQGWPVVSLTVTARPLTDLAAGLARLDNRDPAAVRQRLADAPGQAHLLIRELTRNAVRLVLIVDQFERVFAADGAQERAERAARGEQSGTLPRRVSRARPWRPEPRSRPCRSAGTERRWPRRKATEAPRCGPPPPRSRRVPRSRRRVQPG
jgi:dienelactone hydrolase